MNDLQSLGLYMRVKDMNGDEIDLKQNYDDDEAGVVSEDVPLGDDVLVESELSDGYTTADGEDIEPETEFVSELAAEVFEDDVEPLFDDLLVED
ncbi:MAG: hypothetical protein Q4G07_08410 [Oscillospiraceae bacterium]|nr:hypothetical protein [Oscillospiraceae bacterium]